MTESSDSRQPLEELIDRTLRELPARQAPRTLEMRVLREIERRNAQSSSKFVFMSWPLAVRAVFVLVCVAIANLATASLSWGAAQVLDALRFIPLNWVTGILVFAAAMYAALFALGTAAYRTLSVER